jgi:hypothetical protein
MKMFFLPLLGCDEERPAVWWAFGSEGGKKYS